MGNVCWTAPAAVGAVKKGELRCASPEAVANLEGQIAVDKERAAAQKRWEDDLRKATAKKAEEEKKEAARRKAEEKAQAAAEANFKANAPARAKVSDLLAKGEEERRLAELKKTADVKKKELQEFLAEYGARSPPCRLEEMAWGAAAGKACALKEVQARPWPNVVPPSQPMAQPSPKAPQQFDATVKGDPSKVRVNVPPQSLSLTEQQHDYLKQNAANLPPEQRKLTSLQQPTPAPSQTASSTFASPMTQPQLAPRLPTSQARAVLPYALMARDAYEASSAPVGYVREADWKSILAKGGASQTMIKKYEDAGFAANIYRNTATNELVISYRGSEGNPLSRNSPDWMTNRRAITVDKPESWLEEQYVAAASLAARAKNLYGPNITLTGHSLGGGLASYAGSYGDFKVVTFNAARNSYSSRGSNRNQTNIIVPNDTVGDARAALGGQFGDGQLPGQYYSVPTSSDTSGAYGPVLRHGMDGIIGGLSDIARQ